MWLTDLTNCNLYYFTVCSLYKLPIVFEANVLVYSYWNDKALKRKKNVVS